MVVLFGAKRSLLRRVTILVFPGHGCRTLFRLTCSEKLSLPSNFYSPVLAADPIPAEKSKWSFSDVDDGAPENMIGVLYGLELRGDGTGVFDANGRMAYTDLDVKIDNKNNVSQVIVTNIREHMGTPLSIGDVLFELYTDESGKLMTHWVKIKPEADSLRADGQHFERYE
jgi:hypothetical protein